MAIVGVAGFSIVYVAGSMAAGKHESEVHELPRTSTQHRAHTQNPLSWSHGPGGTCPALRWTEFRWATMASRFLDTMAHGWPNGQEMGPGFSSMSPLETRQSPLPSLACGWTVMFAVRKKCFRVHLLFGAAARGSGREFLPSRKVGCGVCLGSMHAESRTSREEHSQGQCRSVHRGQVTGLGPLVSQRPSPCR